MFAIADDPSDPRVLEFSREEIQGLLERSTRVVVQESDLRPGLQFSNTD